MSQGRVNDMTSTEQWKELDAVIGGQISIDIAPKGMNKSQVLNKVKEYMVVRLHQHTSSYEHSYYTSSIKKCKN